MDWLKLEDVNASLFLVSCNRKARAWKRPGQRQPRYLKFFLVGVGARPARQYRWWYPVRCMHSLIWNSSGCSRCVTVHAEGE